MSFDLIDIQIKDPLREKGVMYVGQYGTSGYAIAARGYICDFMMKGIPVSWVPLKFDDSEISDDNQYNLMAKSAIKRQISNIQTVILHCTADLWPKYKAANIDKFINRNVIGYTVWETNQLPPDWSKYINETVTEVWCPSRYNEITFKNSGIKIPIRIVPHVFLKNELPLRHHIIIKDCVGDILKHDPNVFTFYNISELNERKNVMATIESFCKAFTSKDPVRLILKTHYKDYSAENVTLCIGKISKFLKNYSDHAPIYLLTRNLTEIEMLALHSIGDCYVSLTRSEAFGLTIFDAFNYGKKIIVTANGGQVDYLGDDYSGLVNYDLVDVSSMEEFTHGYYMQGKQQWANPSIEHAVELMKKTVNST